LVSVVIFISPVKALAELAFGKVLAS
jgi:hypothetical protein